MKTIKGILLTDHSGLDKLQRRDDILLPESGSCDVLVQVGVAGENNTDLNSRIGWYPKLDGDSSHAIW